MNENTFTAEEWSSISWNAKVLFQTLPVQSPIFKIRNMVCNLYFEQNPDSKTSEDYFELILKGKRAEPIEWLAFWCQSHILDMRLAQRFLQRKILSCTEKSFECCIWREKKETILLKRYNMVEDCEWLNFICSFGPSVKNPDYKKTELELRCNFKNSTTLEKLSSDYMGLLESGNMYDSIIVCVNGNINVHRLILCARSKIFKDMFEKEENDGVLNMTHMRQSVLHPVLTFLYSGTLSAVNEKNMYRVYEASHNLQLDVFKIGCMNFLIRRMNVYTFMKYLKYARRCNDTTFKMAIGACILHAKSFLDNTFWQNIHDRFRRTTTWSLDDPDFVSTLPKVNTE